MSRDQIVRRRSGVGRDSIFVDLFESFEYMFARDILRKCLERALLPLSQ